MTFRKVIFWAHLGCGVSAGLVILVMSVTGVLLTYERQIIDWADQRSYKRMIPGDQRQSLASVIHAARQYMPEPAPSSVTLWSDRQRPAAVALGRERVVYVDPFTAEVAGEGNREVREFFSLVTHWHRWLDVPGDNRGAARAVTGASNLVFLVLVLSGIYLWFPRIWKWPLFKVRLRFNRHNQTGRVRDYNWHHVLGFWTSIPLAVIIACAVVFSYPWANSALFGLFGEEPPVRGAGRPGAGGPPRGMAMQRQQSTDAGVAGEDRLALPPDAAIDRVQQLVAGWRSITVRLPERQSRVVNVTIDRGNGGQPHKQSTATLDIETGELVALKGFTDESPGRQARSLVRRLHTGEALGIAGQTIAGLASLAGVVLVWTGLALAYRRLLQPLLAHHRKRGEPVSRCETG